MCFEQEIHTAYCAELLTFDGAAREHHVCDKAYPAPAPAPPNAEDGSSEQQPTEDRRCHVHSCCCVTTELVSECVAVREARARPAEAGGEDRPEKTLHCGAENPEYREVVFVPFGPGEEPEWESTMDREVRWEILWDAADDEGYTYASEEVASRRGSGTGKGDRHGGSRCRRRSSGTESYCYSDGYEYSEYEEDDAENEPEFLVDSPYMEFWTFGSDGSDDCLYSDVATTTGGPGGKVFVYFDEPPDVCELQISGSSVVGRWADGGAPAAASAANKESNNSEREPTSKSWFGRRAGGSGGSGWWWNRRGSRKDVNTT